MSSSNDNITFKKTSFLSGVNSEFINKFYSDYLSDPKSLPEGWKKFFDGLSEDEKLILDDLNGPSWSPEKKIKKINFSQNETKEKNVESIDTIVGISINGILFAHEIASQLNVDVAIHRDSKGESGGHLSTKYGQVGGKRVVVVDDVLSTGSTIKNTISLLKRMGAEVVLALVLVNKTQLNEIEGVPLRGLIRTVTV